MHACVRVISEFTPDCLLLAPAGEVGGAHLQDQLGLCILGKCIPCYVYVAVQPISCSSSHVCGKTVCGKAE